MHLIGLDAGLGQRGERRFQKARSWFFAASARGFTFVSADAGAAAKDAHFARRGDQFADEFRVDSPATDMRAKLGGVELARQRVDYLELLRIELFQLRELSAKDDVGPSFVAVNQRVFQARMVVQAVFVDAVIRHNPGARAHVDQVVRLLFDVRRQHVRSGEAHDRQPRAARQPMHQQRRKQRRILGGAARVFLFLDGDRQIFFVRGGCLSSTTSFSIGGVIPVEHGLEFGPAAPEDKPVGLVVALAVLMAAQSR